MVLSNWRARVKKIEYLEKSTFFKRIYLALQTTFRVIVLTFFVVLAMLFTAQLRSADSVENSVCQELSS
jgi:hypothetical protein